MVIWGFETHRRRWLGSPIVTSEHLVSGVFVTLSRFYLFFCFSGLTCHRFLFPPPPLCSQVTIFIYFPCQKASEIFSKEMESSLCAFLSQPHIKNFLISIFPFLSHVFLLLYSVIRAVITVWHFSSTAAFIISTIRSSNIYISALHGSIITHCFRVLRPQPCGAVRRPRARRLPQENTPAWTAGCFSDRTITNANKLGIFHWLRDGLLCPLGTGSVLAGIYTFFRQILGPNRFPPGYTDIVIFQNIPAFQSCFCSSCGEFIWRWDQPFSGAQCEPHERYSTGTVACRVQSRLCRWI